MSSSGGRRPRTRSQTASASRSPSPVRGESVGPVVEPPPAPLPPSSAAAPPSVPPSDEKVADADRIAALEKRIEARLADVASNIFTNLVNYTREETRSSATAASARPGDDAGPVQPPADDRVVFSVAGMSRDRGAVRGRPDSPDLIAELASRNRPRGRPPNRPVAPQRSAIQVAADSLVDGDGDGDGDDEQHPRPSPSLVAPPQWVSEILGRVRTHGSFYRWVLDYPWKDQRNRHEVVALATAIDFARRDDFATCLEVLCRRAAAVQLADLHNNWAVADRVEYPYPHSSLLSQEAVAAVARDASAVDRIGRAARGHRRGRGRGARTSSRTSDSKFGVGSKVGGAGGN